MTRHKQSGGQAYVITVLIIGALLLLSSGIERNIMSVVNIL